MQCLQLGRSGVKVSRIGLGIMSFGNPTKQAWAMAEDEAEPIVRDAFDSGVNFFDTADMYSDGASEVITGGTQRHRSTKPWPCCTTWWGPAKPDTSAHRPRARGNSARLSTPPGQHAIGGLEVILSSDEVERLEARYLPHAVGEAT
jgi:hypothetical protein